MPGVQPCRGAPRPDPRPRCPSASWPKPAFSMSASGRVRTGAGSGAIAGSRRNRGGVVGSAPTAGTTRNCMTWPVVSGSAASKSSSGIPPPNGSSGPTLPEDVAADRHVREVDDDVGALGQAHEDPVVVIRRDVHRRRQEAALVADLPDLDARDLVEVEDQEAGLAAVEEAEPVAPLLDDLERPGVAVDHDACCRRTRGSRSARTRRPGCSRPMIPSKNSRVSG